MIVYEMFQCMNNKSHFWKLTPIDTIKQLKSSDSKGLDHNEVTNRHEIYGKNSIVQKDPVSNWEVLLRQIKSLIVGILFLASIISFFLNQWVEAISIIIVIVINTLIGFLTEIRAIRSVESLKLMGITATNVIRNGNLISINAEELVPGDIVILEAGDIVTADLRLIEASKVTADESVLTGESVPVEKSTETLVSNTILPERTNMLYKGTFLVQGSAKGIVVATGMHTELGMIALLTQGAQDTQDELTPLEKRLNKLGEQLVWISVIIGSLVALSGIISDKPALLMFKTAVALAIATIPEGLPIVATMALAKGVWRMAKRNAIVKRLSAVETLGATSIIFTDKTGTLTENKMTVNSFYFDEGLIEATQCNDENLLNFYKKGRRIEMKELPSLKRGLEIGALCNNASLNTENVSAPVGDPMEIALLNIFSATGNTKNNLLETYPELYEEAFDPQNRMMATYHQNNEHVLIAVKGAPESIINSCAYMLKKGEIIPMSSDSTLIWKQRNEQMANDGHRVLGLAYKTVDDKKVTPYKDLIFVGLVGISDPARPEIKLAIEKCRTAGVKVIMVTGDQAGTAKKIGKDIGLFDGLEVSYLAGDKLGPPTSWSEEFKQTISATAIFSRVSPQQKLDLVQFYQDQNYVVAMTGDGVNDAPALRKADIGVAMGKRGTQVAREASDIILKDDSFNSIISAIQQGRVIYNNIQRFVVYLLSCNISEVLVVSIAAIVNAPMALLPLQILFLNLVTDVFPALALGMGDGDESYLKFAPRKTSEPVIPKKTWRKIILFGLIITISVLGSFFYALEILKISSESALSVSFLTLGFAQTFHVFNMRLSNSKLISNDITRNIYIWGALIICTLLLLVSVYIGVIANALSLVQPTSEEWLIILIFSCFPFFIGQAMLFFGHGIDN